MYNLVGVCVAFVVGYFTCFSSHFIFLPKIRKAIDKKVRKANLYTRSVEFIDYQLTRMYETGEVITEASLDKLVAKIEEVSTAENIDLKASWDKSYERYNFHIDNGKTVTVFTGEWQLPRYYIERNLRYKPNKGVRRSGNKS